MSNNRRPLYIVIFIIAVVVVLTAVIIMWFKPDSSGMAASETTPTAIDNESNDSAPELSQTSNGLATPPALNNTRFTTGLEDLPRSLQGTQVDGEIIIDEQQQLVVTEGLRRLFDYFLSALGEEDEAVIYARVESYIRNHTPEPAASQAVAIFDRYIRYLKQLSQIEERYGNLQLQATKNAELDLNVVAQRQQDVTQLRQQHFDAATITAFFGAEDDYDTYSIAMLDINQNTQLSEGQKAAARQDYISRMPNNATKTNIEQQANLNELMTRTEQMKKAGTTSDELYNMRRELVGEAAATRLARVDQEDDNFEQRFNQYQAQKLRLLNQNAGNAQLQLTQLEQQLFSSSERKRLAGYGAMQQAENQ